MQIGNVFIMLFAGHGGSFYQTIANQQLTSGFIETSAHTLAAAIGLLSIHDDIQEEVLGQICSVVGYDRDPVSH